MSNRAWVTLATNDSYGLGALVLAHSLRRAGSAFPAVVLITPSVTEAMRERLREVFAEVIIVDVLDSGDAAHLALLQRPELGITFTKLHCWNLTQYEKCVFLDADTLIVQNCDELFDREELSAAPDVGWPDCFNSGVFVFKPSTETFSNLIKFAQERGSFDGGDQGLLNLYFSDWAHGDINKHLPFLYNVTSAAFYSYLPALKQYGQNLKIIHFIGATKPWLQHYNWRTGTVEGPDHQRDFLQLWWSIFVAEVHTKLDNSMVKVEEPPLANLQHEPEHADQGLNTGHYEATLNPLSEFPWHHPDNQIEYHREDEPTIDMTEFHDPWNIYRGHIPPITDDSNQEKQPNVDHHEVRKYAWEYMPPVYEESHKNHAPSLIESPFTEHPFQETHHTNFHEDYKSPQIDQRGQHFHEKSHAEYVHHSDHHEPSKSINNYISEHHHTDLLSKKNTSNEYSKLPSHIQHDASKTDNNLIAFSDNTHHSKIVNVNEKPEYVSSKPQETAQSLYTIKLQEPAQNLLTPYVYTVHLDHNNKNENDGEIANGYISDDECDTYEEIIPRHPYDGFYLRHRNTIDSRGRKICSHEISYLPHSPTPTPPDSPEVFEDALDFLEETNEMNGENHTGVAGHLARIGSDLKSDAIDELVRRQGWEAGNIDYMGADSFANIWAKISHTLSQTPSSPPKEESLPAQSSVGGKDSSPLKEPLPVPVEVAVKDQPQEESLSVPVETDTEKLAPKEPLPMPTQTDIIKPEEPLLEPVKTDTKELAQEEHLPVPVETDTKNLSTEEPLPETVETDIKKVSLEESVSVPVESDPKKLPLEEPVPIPAEAVSKELPLKDLTKPIEADSKTVSSETHLPPIEADKIEPSLEAPSLPIDADTKELSSEVPPVVIEGGTKGLPSEIPPVPIETETEVLTSEIPPVPIEADTKGLPSKVPPVPIETETKVLASEIPPTPIEVDTKGLPSEVPPVPIEADTKELPSEVPPVTIEAETKSPVSEVAPIPIKSDTQSLEAHPPQTAESNNKETPEKPIPVKSDTSPSEDKTEIVSDVPVSALEALKLDEKKSGTSDSPPLATSPSKEDATAVPAAKSEERRKPAGKLQLHPPAAADPLPTPDSELEDAATLAQSIIASELRTPTVTSPSPTTEPPPNLASAQTTSLGVQEPEVPTPPVGAVSLTQIGIKSKSKPTIAAQIESSVSPKTESTPQTPSGSTPSTPSESDAPKKKLVKKVPKKEKEGASSGEAPVPPPRKKEKKPKDK